MIVVIAFIKKHFGDTPIIGAEVGVFTGKHALQLLNDLPNLVKLYLIDPYEAYDDYSPARIKEIVLGPQKAQELLDRNNVDPLRYEWVITHFSADVVPEPLDFVYIDANHQYDAVKFDILEARKIVKMGGIIGGHDYRAKGGVSDAVHEVFGDDFHHGGKKRRTDWWTIHKCQWCEVWRKLGTNVCIRCGKPLTF